jgi:2-phosphosulfolactate phosphatase
MGWNMKEKAPEDNWCARYIAHLLGKGEYSHDQAMREIVFNPTAQRFLGANETKFPPEDPVLCLQRNVYNYALIAQLEDNAVIIHNKDIS